MWRQVILLAAGLALALSLAACGGGNAVSEEVVTIRATVHALEETMERMEGRIAGLESADLNTAAGLAQARAEIAQMQSDVAEALDNFTALSDGVEELETLIEEDDGAIEELAAVVKEIGDGLKEIATATEEIGTLVYALEAGLFHSDAWDKSPQGADDNAVEDTADLAEATGADVRIIGGDERPAVLVLPYPLPEKVLPLIVSLHGFSGNSLWQSHYLPLHRQVNTGPFALLLPNGTFNADGNRFWNPTGLADAKGGPVADDVAYLAALVEEAGQEAAIGPVYFFGYSNGGFMAYYMACKWLPGLRAVASLAGTSYVDDAACEGAPPVSVLHIHGTADGVILFGGDSEGPSAKGDGEPAFYAGAQDMVTRWASRAGCDWPENPEPYAALDFDQDVPGAETQAYRLQSGCAEGVSVELWVGEGSSHGPGYGDAFVDALLDWLLSQQ